MVSIAATMGTDAETRGNTALYNFNAELVANRLSPAVWERIYGASRFTYEEMKRFRDE